MSWNVAGQEIWPVLCVNDLGLKAWKQDFEHRVYWTPIEHESARECLKTAREMLPGSILYLNENESKILIVADDHMMAFLWRITKDNES